MSTIGAETSTPMIWLPRPHRGQALVRLGARRFNWLSAGRRWRKTTMGMAILTEAMLAGKRCFVGAPTYDQVRLTWDEMKRAAGSVFNFRESRMEVRSPNNGKCSFRSLDNPNNARGHTADVVCIDEAAYCPEEAYTEVLRPMLMDTRGELWAYSTPNGFGWFHKHSVAAMDREDSSVWQVPTLGAHISGGTLTRAPHPLENPNITWDELVSMAATMHEMSFRQEVLAETVAREGRVFGDFRRDVHVREVPFNRTLPVILGVDFGYRTFAAEAVQVDSSDSFRIFADAEWNGLTTQQAITRLRAMWWADAVEFIACDPAGDAHNVQSGIGDVQLFRSAFPNARVTFSTSPAHRDPEWRASRLRDRIWSATGTPRLFVDPSCIATIRMLEGSVYPKHNVGQPEKTQPLKDGINDHLRDALGYLEACYCHRRQIATVA